MTEKKTQIKHNIPDILDTLGEFTAFDPLKFMGNTYESKAKISQNLFLTSTDPKTVRIHLKARKKNSVKQDHLAEMLTTLPQPGTSYHVISSGNFDFWTYVPHIVNLAGHIDDFYCSTWTLNRYVAEEMLELFDQKKILKINMLTGLYFKRRESAVYATLLQGLVERGQRYIAFLNHTKIMLLEKDPDYFVIEGSANLTANPRVEQFILSNHKGLYNFHKEWMEAMYAGK